MEIIERRITGSIIILKDTQYNNVEAINVTIAKGVTVRIYGHITGSVILKAGARLYLHGILFGNVNNEGGEIHVYPSE